VSSGWRLESRIVAINVHSSGCHLFSCRTCRSFDLSVVRLVVDCSGQGSSWMVACSLLIPD
jgi:hypothetical protein